MHTKALFADTYFLKQKARTGKKTKQTYLGLTLQEWDCNLHKNGGATCMIKGQQHILNTGNCNAQYRDSQTFVTHLATTAGRLSHGSLLLLLVSYSACTCHEAVTPSTKNLLETRSWILHSKNGQYSGLPLVISILQEPLFTHQNLLPGLCEHIKSHKRLQEGGQSGWTCFFSLGTRGQWSLLY